MVKVPSDAENPSFDDTFDVSIREWRKAAKDEVTEWTRRREVALKARAQRWSEKADATLKGLKEKEQAKWQEVEERRERERAFAEAEAVDRAVPVEPAVVEAVASVSKPVAQPRKLTRMPPKTDCVLEEYRLKGDTLRKGVLGRWPIAGATAEFTHGADLGSRVTFTRVVLTGVFALALKKNKNKVYVAIDLASGEQLLVEAPAKRERLAREFAININRASEFYANPS